MDPTDLHIPRRRPPLFIGLCGLAGVGKDTVAGLLATHCGAVPIAFADALRKEIGAAYCLDLAYLTRRETKEHPITALALNRCLDSDFVQRMRTLLGSALDMDAPRSPRQIMQWWGTEYRRAQCPWYWISRASATCHQAMGQGAHAIVLTDVRMANEAAMLRTYSGSLWQIKRPGYAQASTPGHSSEVDGSAFAPDAILNNGYDIGHLQHIVLTNYSDLLCAATNSYLRTSMSVALESEVV